MTRILAPLRGARQLGAGAGRILAMVLVPETSEEAVVEVGLALLAAGFLVAGFAPLALLVPGGLLVAVGLGFNLRRRA